MSAIVFEAERIAYIVADIADSAMTVGELYGYLQDMDDDDIVVISHDNGYTYGSLNFIGELSEDEYDDED